MSERLIWCRGDTALCPALGPGHRPPDPRDFQHGCTSGWALASCSSLATGYRRQPSGRATHVPLRPPADTLLSPERPPSSRAHGHLQLGQSVCGSGQPRGVQGVARPEQLLRENSRAGAPAAPHSAGVYAGLPGGCGEGRGSALLAFLQGDPSPHTHTTHVLGWAAEQGPGTQSWGAEQGR